MLRILLEHLVAVAAQSDVNKMEPKNLGVVFGPTLLRGLEGDGMAAVVDIPTQAQTVYSLIEHFHDFNSDKTAEALPEMVGGDDDDDDDDDDAEAGLNVSGTAPLTPDATFLFSCHISIYMR